MDVLPGVLLYRKSLRALGQGQAETIRGCCCTGGPPGSRCTTGSRGARGAGGAGGATQARRKLRWGDLWWCVMIWVCLEIVYPRKTQWFCWLLSLLNGYFIGNIPYFQTNPSMIRNSWDDPTHKDLLCRFACSNMFSWVHWKQVLTTIDNQWSPLNRSPQRKKKADDPLSLLTRGCKQCRWWMIEWFTLSQDVSNQFETDLWNPFKTLKNQLWSNRKDNEEVCHHNRSIQDLQCCFTPLKSWWSISPWHGHTLA